MADPLPNILVAAGTYNGVLAGWQMSNNNKKLEITFASPVHGGSVRSLAVAGSNNLLLSSGYDEMLLLHDFSKHKSSAGQVRTDFGTPVCSSFAPPAGNHHNKPSTHCLIGFAASHDGSGKLVIYKKRDWSIQHVMAGHKGGMASLAVHPTGKMALSGGTKDGKLVLWDLTKGRLAYCHTVCRRQEPVVSVVWSRDGSVYAFAYGSHVTVRHVETGKELVDVDLPSRVNEICLIQGDEGLFVAVAGNDGSLPVLAVPTLQQSEQQKERHAIMAIEPVEGTVAGEERFKCIQSLGVDYYVVTANSAGVISLMNLRGAVNMILQDAANEKKRENENEEEPVHPESDEDDENDEEEELAVDIIDSVRLGTGARITCLAAWCTPAPTTAQVDQEGVDNEQESDLEANDSKKRKAEDLPDTQRKRPHAAMDEEALDKARKLVSKAKKIQKRKEKKKNKDSSKSR